MKDKLKFDEKSHTYTLGTKKLTSVTTFLSGLFPKFDKRGISKRVAKYHRDTAKKEIVALKAAGKTPSQELIARSKMRCTDVEKGWKSTTDNGTVVHKEVEEYYLKKRINLSKLSTQALRIIEYLDAAIHKKGNIELRPELQVCAEELALAGTIDMVVISPDGKRATIYDFKTNKKRDIKKSFGKCTGTLDGYTNSKYEKYRLQINVYAWILDKVYGYDIEELRILHSMPDEMVIYDIPYTPKEITTILKQEGLIND